MTDIFVQTKEKLLGAEWKHGYCGPEGGFDEKTVNVVLFDALKMKFNASSSETPVEEIIEQACKEVVANCDLKVK